MTSEALDRRENPPPTISSIQIGPAEARLVERGDGRPVIVFGAGFADSLAHRALASRFRVVVCETTDPDARAVGEAAAAWTEGQGLEQIGLIGLGDRAAAAIWCAAKCGEAATSALVLVSPRGLPAGGMEPDEARNDGADALARLLRELPVPKAIVVGTEDPQVPRHGATRLKKGFSKANVILLYGAGAEPSAERPDAFASVVGDFLDRQRRFRVATESVAVQP